MKKLIIFLVIVCIVIGVDCCSDKRSDKSEDDIYVARDYAMSVFEDTMPDDYTIVKAKGTVGDIVKDSIYEITFTYTIGDDDEEFSHRYTVSVEEDECTILEEESVK